MALVLKPDTQLVFFNKVFSNNYDVVKTVTKLIDIGVTFDTTLYMIKVCKGKDCHSISLSVGTTTLMKGQADPEVANHNKKLISDGLQACAEKWLTDLKPSTADSALQEQDPADDKPLPPGTDEKSEKAENLAGEKLLAALDSVPTDEVVYLRDAKALGQKVHGTAKGSVYHTIALNSRVKVAAKIGKDGTISIRVECDDAEPDELQRVKKAVAWKQTYGSTHMVAGDIPPARCIGAFVMGLGIVFTSQVQHEGQLVVQHD